MTGMLCGWKQRDICAFMHSDVENLFMLLMISGEEDYINVFTENRQDFECVAKVMGKWASGSIDFDDGISSANQEIEKEISGNADFNNSLTNLYDLKEISYILIEDDEITFYFSKFPKDYHGGISYGKNLKEKFGTILIDDDWALKMLPNV